MLVIHNGVTMFPDNQNPQLIRPGSTVKTPIGTSIGPASDGLDLGGGWFLAKPLEADPIPDGFEGTEIKKEMIAGVPKFVHVLREITPEMLLSRRVIEMQTKCRSQILAVADELTQMNLSASHAANRMTQADEATYLAGLDWKDQMVAHCRALILDPNLVEDWPVPTPEIIALAKKY